MGEWARHEFYRRWLEHGYAGEMAYLARSADQRADVRAVLPSARTVIVTATIYYTDRPHSIECADWEAAMLTTRYNQHIWRFAMEVARGLWR